MNVMNEMPSSYDSNKDFTSLDAWKKCRRVKLFFYNEIVPQLPKEEQYALSSQIRRAAVSTTANIAEGYGRFHYQEGIQFYRIARESLYELKDHLVSCYDLNFIDKSLLQKGLPMIEDAKRCVNGYIKYVKNRKQNS